DGTFDYRVKACNSASCSGISGKKAIHVLKVPTVPLNVTAPAESHDGRFTLSWSPSFETVDYYQIDWAKDGETCPGTDRPFCSMGPVTSLFKSFSGHEDGTFYFQVRACNASGCSAPTASVSITLDKSV